MKSFVVDLKPNHDSFAEVKVLFKNEIIIPPGMYGLLTILNCAEKLRVSGYLKAAIE